ncbi:MAG: hypothetical protein OXG85_14495 [Chloroflexi bacterium]|nr:hypothetical protein [Chloroflexota bacterium]
MQARLARLKPKVRRLVNRLTRNLDWLGQRLRKGWRWLNSVDIPLSLLQWALLFYAVFGLMYVVATPVFEANDELWHFGYVEHLRKTGSLPKQEFDGSDAIFRQHGSQPPLYYAVMALASAPFNIDDSDFYRLLNPHVSAGQPGAFGNKNLVLPDDSLSQFAGAGLAATSMRLLGLAFGAATIVLVYKIGEIVSPQRSTVAFVAAAITGLNPMFIFVSASVNNDSLAMTLNSALILVMLRTLRGGFSLRRSLSLALLFALTSLTKLTGLVLLPVILLVALLAFRKSQDRRGLAIFLYALTLFWLLIAGWWYFRNVQLYGEPFGLFTMANIAGPRGITFSLADLFSEYQQFRMSYWGLFGALNIQVASIFYLLLDLMTFLSMVGCVFLCLQLLAISDFAYARYELAHLLTLAFALLLLWLGVLYWSTLTRAAEGRVLFPLIGVVSPLLAVGFVEVVWWIAFSLRPPNLEFVRAGDAVPKELLHDAMVWQLRLLGLVALFAPFTVIASQYSAPQPVEAVPAMARPVYAEFGGVALVAYERSDRRYAAGDRVRVTLYWQVLKQSTGDNSIFLTLVDDHGHEIGRYATFPGAGSLRTSRWQADLIYPDEYLINISGAAYGRYPFDLLVEWKSDMRSTTIAATNVEGQNIDPVLLPIGAVVTARSQPSPAGYTEIPVDAQPVFADAIRLESFKLDLDLNEVSLSWKAESTPEDNYTVFAHLLDADGDIFAQDDQTPRLPTKYWRWGESFTTFHRFSDEVNMLDYSLSVGLYIHDGFAYPRLGYVTVLEEDGVDAEMVHDTFVVPWDIADEVLELTATTPPDDAGIENGTSAPQSTQEANEIDAIEATETAP